MATLYLGSITFQKEFMIHSTQIIDSFCEKYQISDQNYLRIDFGINTKPCIIETVLLYLEHKNIPFIIIKPITNSKSFMRRLVELQNIDDIVIIDNSFYNLLSNPNLKQEAELMFYELQKINNEIKIKFKKTLNKKKIEFILNQFENKSVAYKILQ